jgi:hypothetical protein
MAIKHPFTTHVSASTWNVHHEPGTDPAASTAAAKMPPIAAVKPMT